LIWSVVFPIKPGSEIPPEGFLYLSYKQKFETRIFCDKKTIVFHDTTYLADDACSGRLVLGEQSSVSLGKPFSGWARFLDWSPAPAAERLKRHTAGPLDLDTELQEEVILRDYEIGPPAEGDEPGQTVYPVKSALLALHAVVGPPAEGKALAKGLEDLRKKKKDRPPLFGLMHYERCRLVLQPLTAFHDAGPDYITISKEIVNKAALLKALSFT
jgi:hypothetical protein